MASDASDRPWIIRGVRILRVGDPFVPLMLEGVVAHVHVQVSEDNPGYQVRVVMEYRGAKPFAYGYDGEAMAAACQAVVEDIDRRPGAFDGAFAALKAARDLARDGRKRE